MENLLGKTLFSLVALILLAAACNRGSSLTDASAQDVSALNNKTDVLRVVTTSNIVGDWVRQVGGDRIEVFDLLPVGADPHTFQPGARDITRVAEADLLIRIGLNLEGIWMNELIQNASVDDSTILTLGDAIEPIERGLHEVREDGDNEDGHSEIDPHFWFDPLRVKQAVAQVAMALSELDEEGSAIYSANAEAYQSKLDELDEWIFEQFANIPRERRVLVTSHDTFGYFAERYGFEIVGTVIPGVSTERDPTPQELAELVDKIQEYQVEAIFSENTVSSRLTERIAEETGAVVVSGLYTGSLGGPGTDVETYIQLMRANVEIIAEALE